METLQLPASRVCTKCGAEKPLSCFGRQKHGRYGKTARCLDCGKAYYKTANAASYEYRKNYYRGYYRRNKAKLAAGSKVRMSIPRYIYSRTKCGAKARSIPFLITREQFCLMFEGNPACTYCGITLIQSVVAEGKRLGLDRIDSSGPYSTDNVCIACYKCNVIKLNLLTYDDMKEIGPRFVRPKWDAELKQVPS